MYTALSYLLTETMNEKPGFLLQNANQTNKNRHKWIIIEFALIVHIYSEIIFDFNGRRMYRSMEMEMEIYWIHSREFV